MAFKYIPLKYRNWFNDKLRAIAREAVTAQDTPSTDNGETRKMLMYVRNRMYMEMPELISISEEMQELANTFLQRNQLKGQVNLSLSKNDLMFHYSLLHVGNILPAFESYLAVGHQGFTIIRDTAQQAFGGFDPTGNVLDFASGYGRITRFLIREHQPEKVWVSDIKEKAVNFQKKYFGVNGFPSTYQPEVMEVSERFDLIFVGSLFSHLPKSTFSAWLVKLKSLLTERGILAFSVHDISLFGVPGEPSTEHFIFHPSSEDITFSEVEDHIDKSSEYGVTYCSEFFVSNLCKQLFGDISIQRVPKLFGGLQDMYFISKTSYGLKF